MPTTILMQVGYTLLSNAAKTQFSNPMVRDALQPALRSVLNFMQGTLGPADKLSFNLTHVVLTSILLVLVVYLDAIRAAVARR